MFTNILATTFFQQLKPVTTFPKHYLTYEFFYRCMDLKNIPEIAFLQSGVGKEYCNEHFIDLNNDEYTKKVSACCDNADFCNENIKFVLPTHVLLPG